MTADQLENLLGALRGAPRLPEAACAGLWSLFDDPDAPVDALKLCAGCSELRACEAWADSLPRNSLHGVVAGRVYRCAGRANRRKVAS